MITYYNAQKCLIIKKYGFTHFDPILWVYSLWSHNPHPPHTMRFSSQFASHNLQFNVLRLVPETLHPNFFRLQNTGKNEFECYAIRTKINLKVGQYGNFYDKFHCSFHDKGKFHGSFHSNIIL